MAIRKESNRSSLSAYYYGNSSGSNSNNSTINNSNANINKSPEPTAVWLTTTWLCDWFCQGDTLLLALGDIEVLRTYGLEDTHIEILKRLDGILLALADKNMLQISHINLLWKNITSNVPGTTTVDVHVRVILKLLMALANKLSKELIVHLVLKIQSIPRPYDDHHLEYFRVLTENAIYCKISEEILEKNVFSILWNILQNTTSESLSVLNTTAHTIAILLSKLKSDVLILKYLSNSLRIITDGKISSNIIIQFMHYLIGCLDDSFTPTMTRVTVISRDDAIRYCDSNGLLPILLADIQKCLTTCNNFVYVSASKRPNVNNDTLQSMNPSTNVIQVQDPSSSSTYQESIQIRLDFLRFILENSSLELKFNQIRSLWQLFTDNDLMYIDNYNNSSNHNNNNMIRFHTELIMKWFTSAIPEERPTPNRRVFVQPCLTHDATKQLFYEILYVDSMSSTSSSISRSNEKDNEYETKKKGDEIVQRLDCAYIGIDGYKCIEKAFRYVNGSENKISNCFHKSFFIIEDPKLYGMELLFKIYLYALSENVSKICGEFLISLQTRLSPRINRRDLWSSYISYIMKCLHDLAIEHNILTMRSNSGRIDSSRTSDTETNERLKTNVLSENQRRTIIRLLSMLSLFLDEAKKSLSVANSSIPKVDEIRLNIFWGLEPAPPSNNAQPTSTVATVNKNILYVFRKGTVTLGSLRMRIAQDLKVPPQKVRISGAKSKFSTNLDNKLIEQLNLTSFVDVIVLRDVQDDTKDFVPTYVARTVEEDDDSDHMYPRKILSETYEYLELLFEFLSVSDIHVSEATWKLLDILPINQEMKLQIVTLGGALSASYQLNNNSSTVDWFKLLNEKRILILLYKLRIIYDIVLSSLNANIMLEERQNAINWSVAFLHYGGAEHLITLLLKLDSEDMCQGKLHRQCLSLLLHLIDFFTTVEEMPPEESRRKSSISAAPLPPTVRSGDMEEAPEIAVAVEISDEEVVLDATSVQAEPLNEMAVRRGRSSSSYSASSTAIIATTAAEVSSVSPLNQVQQQMRSDGKGARWFVRLDDTLQSANINAIDMTRDLLRILHNISVATVATSSVTGDSLNERTVSNSKEEGKVSARDKAKRRKSRTARLETYAQPSSNTTSGAISAKMFEGVDDDADSSMSQLSTESEIVGYTISLLIRLIQQRSELLATMLEFTDLADSLMYALLITSEIALRKAVSQGLFKLCFQLNQIGNMTATKGFLSLLLPHILDTKKYDNNCNEYFELISNLLCMNRPTSTSRQQNPTSVIEYAEIELLVNNLADEIILRPIIEVSEEDSDLFLRGSITLLNTLLNLCPLENQRILKLQLNLKKDMLHEVFDSCLFALPDRYIHSHIYPPKCKHSDTRALALQLLLNLCINCPQNFSVVLDLVNTHHNIGRLQDSFGLTNDDDIISNNDNNTKMIGPQNVTSTKNTSEKSLHYIPKSKTGYVGLLNPGCICYMNSILQQFYMIPQLRQGIFNFQVEIEENEDIQKNLMYQLQLMFANLQESEKAYYDPRLLCNSMTDFEGNPIDVLTQQDASEFLTNVIQQIENHLMGSKQEKLLKDTFGGIISNELVVSNSNNDQWNVGCAFFLNEFI